MNNSGASKDKKEEASRPGGDMGTSKMSSSTGRPAGLSIGSVLRGVNDNVVGPKVQAETPSRLSETDLMDDDLSEKSIDSQEELVVR